MIDCHDGMVVAHTAGTSPNAEPARHDAGSGPPPRCVPASVPRSHGDRGCHYRWPGWLERMGRYGLVRSTGAKGCSPDNAAAEGFFCICLMVCVPVYRGFVGRVIGEKLTM